MENFSSRLSSLIDEHRISREKLASSIGVVTSTITVYCQNKKQPTLGNLLSIADYFDVSLDYLVGRSTSKDIDIPLLQETVHKVQKAINDYNKALDKEN